MGDDIHNRVSKEIMLGQLDKDKRDRVLEIKSKLDITDENSIMDIGAAVSRDIANMNKSVLSAVKVKDIPEVESIVPQLQSAFNEVDSQSLIVQKQGVIARLFRGNQVKDFVTKFENAAQVVASIQSNLEQIEMKLRKDVEVEERLGRENIRFIQEVEETILAMKLAKDDALLDIEKREKVTDPDDFVARQLIEEDKDKILSLEKQVFWLEQQKLLAIQTLPILKNLKTNNMDMVRQIRSTVEQAIPAWEQGIIIAFHIHRQQGALRVERAIHDMTNQIVRRNSELIKANSIEIAKAVQDGMIDMETFREANKNIIDTTTKLAEIKQTAMKNREQSIREYRQITEKLLESEKTSIKSLGKGTIELIEAGELHV